MNDGRAAALVLGATSDIGRAIAYELAGDGYAMRLAGRDPSRLGREARDIRIRVRTGAVVTLPGPVRCPDPRRGPRTVRQGVDEAGPSPARPHLVSHPREKGER